MMLYRPLLAACLAAAAGAAVAAPTSLIAQDSFEYVTGALDGQNGGSGWASAWTAVGGTTAGGTAAADTPMSGNAARISTNSNAAAQRTLASSVSGDVLVSFVFQFDAGSVERNDFLGLWFGNTTGPNIGLKGNCDAASGCTADLFVRTTGSSGAFSTAINVGESYELVGYLQKVGGSAVYNRYSLWVDPTADELDSLTGADAVFNGASSVSSFSSIGFRSVNLDKGDVLLVDNLRISRVPEPGTLALAGLALLGGALASRRRRA